jgi:hypothetical protein
MLANQAKTPGTTNPGVARPVELDVVSMLPAAPRVAVLVALEVTEGSPNPCPVRVPAVVNTRAGALVLEA